MGNLQYNQLAVAQLYEELWDDLETGRKVIDDDWEDSFKIDFTFKEFTEKKRVRGIRTSYEKILAHKRGFRNLRELKRYWKTLLPSDYKPRANKRIRTFFRLCDELHYARPYYKSNRQWRNFRSKLEGYKNYNQKEIVRDKDYYRKNYQRELRACQKKGFKSRTEYRKWKAQSSCKTELTIPRAVISLASS